MSQAPHYYPGGDAAPSYPPTLGDAPQPAQTPAEAATAVAREGYDVEEVVGSLNGFDELAVKKAFGTPVGELEGTFMLRACAFVLFKRQGQSDREAYDAAMTLTLTQCDEMFVGHEDEPMPDEPVTPAGKDASLPSVTPSSSPH
ncbi:hypothetical protein GCM10027596_26680 [Nocardioides korecus]